MRSLVSSSWSRSEEQSFAHCFVRGKQHPHEQSSRKLSPQMPQTQANKSSFAWGTQQENEAHQKDWLSHAVMPPKWGHCLSVLENSKDQTTPWFDCAKLPFLVVHSMKWTSQMLPFEADVVISHHNTNIGWIHDSATEPAKAKHCLLPCRQQQFQFVAPAFSVVQQPSKEARQL